MGTNRTRIRRPPKGPRFTPEVMATFERLLEFERRSPQVCRLHLPAGKLCEEDDDLRNEYIDLCNRLDHVLLDFEPWDSATPSQLRSYSLQPEYLRPGQVASWQRAFEVRCRLERAVANERLKKAPAPI